MSFLLIGKKIGMTQVFDENNRLLPVTVLEAGPCPVTQLKTVETDGYEAVQIGYGPQKESRLSQPELGHLKKAGVDPVRILQEFRTNGDGESYDLGQTLTVEKFEAGEKVDVIGVSKGQGFQGVVKRHGFSGGPASHGSMTHRRGGSYGFCQDPGHVIKGKKMPGHMGSRRRTVQNLRIVKVDTEKNLLLVKGSLPGANGSLVTVRPAKKRKKAAA
ncbi:MAG: 50S ribosomal protein L3 [Verrucomicrobiota bacterium]